MEQTQTMAELAEALYLARKEEGEAKERRIQLELKIQEKYRGKLPHEGTKSFKAGEFKLKVLTGFTRVVTDEAIKQMKQDARIDDSIIDNVFRTNIKHEVNLRIFKELATYEKDVYCTINEYILTKPKKTNIAIQRL